MYIIQTQKDLEVLKNSSIVEERYLEEVEKQFLNLYQNLSGDEGQPLDEFSLEEKGYIVLLEHGDNLRNLAVVGLDPDGGLLVSIPEFINEIDLGEMTVYEIVIAYNNEFRMTFYLPEEICDKEIMEWLEDNI